MTTPFPESRSCWTEPPPGDSEVTAVLAPTTEPATEAEPATVMLARLVPVLRTGRHRREPTPAERLRRTATLVALALVASVVLVSLIVLLM